MPKLTVDFVMAPEAEGASGSAPLEAQAIAQTVTVHGLSPCSCGSDRFVLASELEANLMTGIPASRMYECTDCGIYRLG